MNQRYVTWSEAEKHIPGCTVLFDINIPIEDQAIIKGIRLADHVNPDDFALIAESEYCSHENMGIHVRACRCWIYWKHSRKGRKSDRWLDFNDEAGNLKKLYKLQ